MRHKNIWKIIDLDVSQSVTYRHVIFGFISKILLTIQSFRVVFQKKSVKIILFLNSIDHFDSLCFCLEKFKINFIIFSPLHYDVWKINLLLLHEDKDHHINCIWNMDIGWINGNAVLVHRGRPFKTSAFFLGFLTPPSPMLAYVDFSETPTY